MGFRGVLVSFCCVCVGFPRVYMGAYYLLEIFGLFRWVFMGSLCFCLLVVIVSCSCVSRLFGRVGEFWLFSGQSLRFSSIHRGFRGFS